MRVSLFAVIVGLIFCFSSCKEAIQVETLWIGTFSEEGIFKADFNTSTGELSNLTLASSVSNPSYLSVNTNNLWAVARGDEEKVLSFKIDLDDNLTLIDSDFAYGKGSCYVDVSGELVAAANYRTGNGIVYKLGSDGGLADELFRYQHSGSSANKERQESAHAHCSIFNLDGQYMYVVDLGTDQVMGYPTTGENTGIGFVAFRLLPGDGPRHLTFHPTEPWAYLINELSSTIVALKVESDGTLLQIDRESTLPKEYSGHNQCADIQVSGDGKFLYGSNRGHNTVVSYSIQKDGSIEFLSHTSVEGDWPRNFVISSNDKFLLVANKNSNDIKVFQRDVVTGTLTFTGYSMGLENPVCLKF